MNNITVDMSTLVSCIQVRASFTKKKFHINEKIEIKIDIK